MLALNLPGFAPKVAEKDGKRTIFDPVRQKYVLSLLKNGYVSILSII